MGEPVAARRLQPKHLQPRRNPLGCREQGRFLTRLFATLSVSGFSARGIVMNLEDLYRLLRNGHLEAQGIVDTVPDPLLLLDENLCVQTASRAFFATF